MKKVYIALEENYNMLASEVGASTILGVYNTIDKALDGILKDIEASINEYDWVMDNDCDLEKFKKDKTGYIRLFYKEQENWDYHCEYSIVEKEIL